MFLLDLVISVWLIRATYQNDYDILDTDPFTIFFANSSLDFDFTVHLFSRMYVVDRMYSSLLAIIAQKVVIIWFLRGGELDILWWLKLLTLGTISAYTLHYIALIVGYWIEVRRCICSPFIIFS